MITFHKYDPTNNMDRMYFVTMCSTLFGETTVIRGYGRRNSPPRLLPPIEYETREDAEKLIDEITTRRLQHGYTITRIDEPENVQ